MNKSMEMNEQKIKQLIEKVRLDKTAPTNIYYFNQTLLDHHVGLKNIKENDICVFGVSIPEEIIRALDLNPIWLLGGSYHMGVSVSDTFPRDVDPVVRAAYGMYRELVEEVNQNINVIIPYHNDSFRKLSWLMKTEGTIVHEFDLPSVKNMDISLEIHRKNVFKLIKDLENTYECKLKPYKLFGSAREINMAKGAINELIKLRDKNPKLLSAGVIFIIMSSYYSCKDLCEYAKEVKSVISEIKNRQVETIVEKPQLLIIGSPMFFPNDKLISIIEGLGAQINFYNNEIAMFFQVNESEGEELLKDMINKISDNYYIRNQMPVNVIEKNNIEKDESKVDGVLFHVLKGEVVYDYELLKLEKYFKEKDIPIFRIETDYSPEDEEQLKIRIEAFIEMLSNSN